MITSHPVLTKSSGWLIIKSYYAAFFAAHSLLRIFGFSCTQLETLEINSVNKIAGAYQSPWTNVTSGAYIAKFDSPGKSITFDQSQKRAHELLWFVFKNLVESWVSHLARPGSDTKYQPAILQLQSLLSSLTYKNHKNGGNWLSAFRNEVNYQHTRDLWFPYKGVRKDEAESLYQIMKNVPENSLLVDLEGSSGNELKKFLNTTIYIVLLAREITMFMQANSRAGSFQKHGPIRLQELLRQ